MYGTQVRDVSQLSQTENKELASVNDFFLSLKIIISQLYYNYLIQLWKSRIKFVEVYIKELHSMMQMPAKNGGIRTKFKPNDHLHKGRKTLAKTESKFF